MKRGIWENKGPGTGSLLTSTAAPLGFHLNRVKSFVSIWEKEYHVSKAIREVLAAFLYVQHALVGH